MDEKDIKTEEEKNIEKGNTNKLLIIFFLVLFIILFTGVIVMTIINNSLKNEIEELKNLTLETENGLNKIADDVNSKIENAIENIVNSETAENVIENTVENVIENKTNDTSSKNNEKPKAVSEIYKELENKFSNFMYRREKGESAGFFIKDKTLYSGVESDINSQVKTEGIVGVPKYIVPINKQIGKTIVLTENGKAFINKEDNSGMYGNTFESYLEEYKFVEIIELGEVYKLYLVTDTGRVLDIDTGIEFKD